MKDQGRGVENVPVDRRQYQEIDTWIDASWYAIDMPWTTDWWQRHHPPHLLYHYTESQGLIGILASQRLFATNALYLNDASELRYAEDLVSSILATLAEEVEQQGVRDLVIDIEDRWKRSSYAGFFVTSFCEEGSLLSQWRAYAGAAGYSIGFATNAWQIRETPGPYHMPPLQLRKVLYQESEQREIILEFMRSACDLYAQGIAKFGEELVATRYKSRMASYVLSVLFAIAPCFKHAAFSEEREWRLIRAQGGKSAVADEWNLEMHFRQSGIGLVPYVQLELPGEKEPFVGRLPIAEVYHGPGLQPELATRALKLLLRKHDYKEPETLVKGANVPLRV